MQPVKAQFVFVSHDTGEFEGKKYDNVILSNGIRAIKLKNQSGKSFGLEQGYTPEKTKVEATLEITSRKEMAIVTLRDMAIVK